MNTIKKFSDQLLEEAIESMASDIHFYGNEQSAWIYFRIHGERKLIQKISRETYDLLLAYYKFHAGMDLGNPFQAQNGKMNYTYQGTASYSLRISTLPAQIVESLSIRILPLYENMDLEELLLFPCQSEHVRRWLMDSYGLILISGPTGSGKTTLLYSLIEDSLKVNSFQTITLEDPIEKTIDFIHQVQVQEKFGMTYSSGLKAALRHDPDLLMIGEIRDRKTAQYALDAALTGHLVLSTMHAKNAIGTIDRLLDMGLRPIDLEQFLIAVGAIQLLPIQKNNRIYRRAAIMELLDGENLQNIIKRKKQLVYPFQTFHHLKRKAYAYGFISKKSFRNEI